MKKLTLFLMASCVALMSYAAGGNITYELNGGVTNPKGWTNKNDMYMGLNQAWNTFSGTSTTWKSLDQLLTEAGGKAADAVPKGIPTQAATMALTFIQDATVKAEWQWLVDYMDATCTAQGRPADQLPSANASYLRYNLSAFFLNSVRAAWPISADYAVAGQAAAFMPAWKHAFAGPATYDGTVDVIIPDPFKEGETFGGWYDNAGLTGEKITKIAAGASGDITLYARWGEYIPTCEEIDGLNNGTTTKASGVVTLIDAANNEAYIQDATGGLRIYFNALPETLVKGSKVVVDGTVASLGAYKVISGATLVSSESASMPSVQTVTISGLLTDVASYMFEYIQIQGLKIKAKSGNVLTVADDQNTTITLIADTDLAVNTKINLKGVASFDGNEVFVIADDSDVSAAPVAGKDPAVYAPQGEGKYNLTNRWLISANMDNLASNPIGKNSFVRGMAAQNGNMYFVDRELKQLTIVDGSTGEKLAPIKLASNIFRWTNDESVEVDAGTLPFNDIKIDNAGNILLGNCITSNAQPFQVWKIDLATGNGTLVLEDVLKNNPDFAEATIRFDAFGVYGDVNGDAIIMAANASAMEAYKWEVKNGVAGDAEVVIIDVSEDGTFLTNLTNPGTAPQIFPLDENYFYLDGNATLPTLIDMDGNVVDGFYNVPAETENWANQKDKKQGHNGIIEFDLANEHFFLMAYTNTLGTPPSSFRLFKWKDANKEFKDIESLWILPAAGMGAASNPYRTAVPSVEVDELSKTATLYLYTGENGYGVYEFKVSDGNGLNDVYNNSAVKLTVNGKKVTLDQQVVELSVFTINGQLISKANKVSSVTLPETGVYILKAMTIDGETAIQKVIVK